MPHTLRKILVLRFSSIGDIVLTTPVIRCLARQSGAEIHVVTKRSFAPVLAHNPYIRKLWLLEQENLAAQLQAEGFDLVVDLHKNRRSRQLCQTLGIRSISFDKLNVRKWLLVNLKVDLLPEKHLVDRYFEALAPMGIHYDGAGLDFFLPDMEQMPNSALLPPGPYVAIAIGAAHATKQIPESGLVQICKSLDAPIVLLGGAAEKAMGTRIAEQFSTRVFNACGLFSLAESAFAIQRSAALITPDTGMMHIGAALAKPLYVVWGNTVPAFGMYPFYPEGHTPARHYEVSPLSCRPCSKLGYGACPLGHFKCMLGQDIDALVGDVLNLFEAA